MVNWYRVKEKLKNYCPEGMEELKDILEYLYIKCDLSLQDIIKLTDREILGAQTLRIKMASLNILIKKRGGDNCSKSIPLSLKDFEQLSAKELAQRYGVHITTIYYKKRKLINASS